MCKILISVGTLIEIYILVEVKLTDCLLLSYSVSGLLKPLSSGPPPPQTHLGTLHFSGTKVSATLVCSSLQLAQGQDGSFRRFAVLEFATAEMAEEARRLNDGRLLGGTNIRVSFCAPGVPGRSMLAALIAAQTMVLLDTGELRTSFCWVCC